MLNTFRFKTGEAAVEANRHYGKQMREILQGVGGRLIYSAPVARTLIGEKEWETVIIIEYPSPEAFLAMATSAALAQASAARIASFADQFLIPIPAGWLPAVYREEPIGATMRGSSAFQELHTGRQAGLSQTSIICSQPAVVPTTPPHA